MWLFIMIWLMYNYNNKKLQSLLKLYIFHFLSGIKIENLWASYSVVVNCKIFVDHIRCRKNFKPYFKYFKGREFLIKKFKCWLNQTNMFASQINTENILNLINQGLYQHVKCSQVIGEFCHEWFREHADDFQFFSQKQNFVYRHYQ